MTHLASFDRRRFLGLGIAGTLGMASGAALGASTDGVTVGDDGLFKQDWFLDTFLEFGDDLAEAAAEGKGLMVLFEQQGCPYCRELHRVNFVHEKLRDFLVANYNVVQIDIFGSREVTDFDGETMEERDLARKWGVHFTPTSVLFNPKAAGSASLAEAEAFRMPGYFKPFHYMSALEYVSRGEYENIGFQRFLQARFDELAAQGIQPEVW